MSPLSDAKTALCFKIPQVRTVISHEKDEPGGHKLSDKPKIGRQIIHKVISTWNIKQSYFLEQRQNDGIYGLSNRRS